jgi:hypothetical protein
LDEKADTSLYNWKNINSLLACGAAVENICVAAQGRGLQADVRLLPNGSGSPPLATIVLTRDEKSEPGGAPGKRELALWQRHTNTLFFDQAPLSESALGSLEQSIAAFPDVRLHLVTAPDGKDRAYQAAACAEQVRFARRDLHEYLHRMIRWNEQEAQTDRTGYTLASMGACGIGETFFRVTRRWGVMSAMNRIGAYKDQAKRANLGLLRSAAVGLLSVKKGTEAALLAAGRAMEALWLNATELGLDLQPHTSIGCFHWAWHTGGREQFTANEQQTLARAFELLQAAFPDVKLADAGDEFGIFLFRVGKGEPVHGYTLRRPVDQTLVD